MRVRLLLLIAAGALLSLFAGFGTFRYARALESELGSARHSLRAFGETVAVPMALRDIPAGSVVRAADFQLVKLPSAYVPTNVLTALPPRAADATLIALADLYSGELIRKGDLSAGPREADFGFILADGGRAFAVAPRNLGNFSARLKAGDTVDLLWTRGIGGGTTETRLVGSALRVLNLFDVTNPANADGNSNKGAGEMPVAPSMIVLEGSTEDAMRAVQAEQSGTFHIMLARGKIPLTARTVVIDAADLADLPLALREGAKIAQTSGVMPGGVVASKRETCRTAIIRGGARSMAEVPC